jgi:hypothetical protein
MKKILLLQISILISLSMQAQRFFYVESGNMAERPVKERLLKASQFVSPTPLMSDYTINTEINFKKETNTASVKITLKDSLTFKTIYQAKEAYEFGVTTLNPEILLNMAMKVLIEENINQIISQAKDNHFNNGTRLIEKRKDKI